jgi:hypothetical protein
MTWLEDEPPAEEGPRGGKGEAPPVRRETMEVKMEWLEEGSGSSDRHPARKPSTAAMRRLSTDKLLAAASRSSSKNPAVRPARKEPPPLPPPLPPTAAKKRPPPLPREEPDDPKPTKRGR